jgi:hypothetical protein
MGFLKEFFWELKGFFVATLGKKANMTLSNKGIF